MGEDGEEEHHRRHLGPVAQPVDRQADHERRGRRRREEREQRAARGSGHHDEVDQHPDRGPRGRQHVEGHRRQFRRNVVVHGERDPVGARYLKDQAQVDLRFGREALASGQDRDQESTENREDRRHPVGRPPEHVHDVPGHERREDVGQGRPRMKARWGSLRVACSRSSRRQAAGAASRGGVPSWAEGVTPGRCVALVWGKMVIAFHGRSGETMRRRASAPPCRDHAAGGTADGGLFPPDTSAPPPSSLSKQIAARALGDRDHRRM
jgi:hypothetical protein